MPALLSVLRLQIDADDFIVPLARYRMRTGGRTGAGGDEPAARDSPLRTTELFVDLGADALVFENRVVALLQRALAGTRVRDGIVTEQVAPEIAFVEGEFSTFLFADLQGCKARALRARIEIKTCLPK